jgi:hypothetical protein
MGDKGHVGGLKMGQNSMSFLKLQYVTLSELIEQDDEK